MNLPSDNSRLALQRDTTYGTAPVVKRTEEHPAYDVHIGEIVDQRRFVIIWLHGQRYEGWLDTCHRLS